MASTIFAVRGQAFAFTTALVQQADTRLLKINPTLAAGDVQVSLDYGAFANLTTLPDAEPDGGYAVRVQLSAAEMTADTVVVLFHDVSGAEWCDQLVTIRTGAVGYDALARAGADGDTLETLSDQLDSAAGVLDTVSTTVDDVLADTSTDGVVVGSTSLSAIAAAVWDRLTTALTTAGSIGAHLLQKVGLLSSGATVLVSAPVAGTAVTTYQGDDYLAEDGRELVWTVSSSATLSGGTVAVIVHGVGAFAGAVASETSITCELTRAQTATIPAGRHRYQIVVTQPDGDELTLVDGVWTSKSRTSAS